MSQVTPATSLRRCGSGERWLSIHMNSSESPIHMMPAMTWIQRSSRLSHSRSVASMPFGFSPPTDGSYRPNWQVSRNATEYAVLLHRGSLCGSAEGGMRMAVSRLLAGVVILLLSFWGAGVMSATTNAVGRPLPADAAPPEQQVLTGLTQPATTLDFFVSVYKRPQNVDGNSWSNVLSTPLVRLDKNFNLVPAEAKSWEASKDGLTWTFHLDKSETWSDGTPLTADDFVSTFRLGADPKQAWDFAWFFSAIKGWDDAVKGTIPVDQIGVQRGSDPYTLVVTTTVPAPYLPGMMLYSPPLQAKALAASGPFYNTDPATSASSGPYVLQEWAKDQRIVLVANPKYSGVRPYIQKLVLKFADLHTES